MFMDGDRVTTREGRFGVVAGPVGNYSYKVSFGFGAVGIYAEDELEAGWVGA
jgi:hypothetical protein